MYPDEMREYLMSKEAVTEEEPFGPEVLVYKVGGKMFATLGIDDLDGAGRCNLKCDPRVFTKLGFTVCFFSAGIPVFSDG